MSEINKDSDVTTEGRKQPLKGVEAPLRDQIVEKLYRKLEELKIGESVKNLWQKGNANRTDWLKRQQIYLASWDEHLIASTEGAFDGASQLHIPMPLIVSKTLHARFLQALWQDPPFSLKARNEASTERVPVVSDTLRYTLLDYANQHKGIEEVVDRWVWDWVTTGSGIKKWTWDVKYTRFVDVETVQEEGPQAFKVVDGKQVAVKTFRPVEREVKRTKKIFDGPVCTLIDAEDLLIIGGGGDPDRADTVIQREYLTGSDLWTLADRKIFKSDKVKLVITSGEDAITGGTNNEVKTQRAENAGRTDADANTELERYEILEAYLKVDVDGSGITSDVIAWVHADTGALLRATYLHRVSKCGERPFAKADFHLRKGQEYGTGVVEMLYPLSREMDAIHNLRIDFGILSVMPFGFYRASSGIDPKTIELEPGCLIPVDNPQTDVYFPNLGNRTVFGFQEEAAIQTMVERLTGISDLSLGLLSGQGATRTATGARALVGEMSSNLDVYLRRLNRAWKKSLRYSLHMLQQRLPEGLSYRLTGDDGKDYWRTVKNADDIAGDYDIEVSPNSSSSNMGIQQEQAMQIMQAVADPIAIQLGIVTPEQYYQAKKNVLQSIGARDYGRYLAKPQGVGRIYTPEEEANRLLRGIEVPVGPEQDHQGFLDYFQYILKHDELLGQFNEQEVVLLAAQAKKHEQMLQALAGLQAQQANAKQMQTNAMMSQQQAPTGMSPMAGAGAQMGGEMPMMMGQ